MHVGLKKMRLRAVRIAYAIEFLLAWITALTAWSQVGGQNHLDVMSWEWVLFLPLAWAGAFVKMTVLAVEGEKAWNRRTRNWLAVCMLLAAAMAAVTYYYHLQEPGEEEEFEEETTTAALYRNAGIRIHLTAPLLQAGCRIRTGSAISPGRPALPAGRCTAPGRLSSGWTKTQFSIAAYHPRS
jgi:hypothetical protein